MMKHGQVNTMATLLALMKGAGNHPIAVVGEESIVSTQ